MYHKLQLSHAYSQIELEPESRTFVTITPTVRTHPFGVSSAPAQFQRIMESLLVVDFDDTLVTGDSAAESFQNLDQVLERLDKVETSLKKEKCTSGAEEIVILGHRINRFGIKPLDEKMEALVQAKPPETQTVAKESSGSGVLRRSERWSCQPKF